VSESAAADHEFVGAIEPRAEANLTDNTEATPLRLNMEALAVP
jgi:hypothetical protein